VRARREAEFARSSKDSVDWEKRKAGFDAAYGKWHTEEARIDNAYQTAMADYANRKAAYEKDKAEYAAASFLHRQLMKEPVDPGVAPVREANKLSKPADLDGRPAALIAEIDRAGCFAYSAVNGATANDLPGMLPIELREERRARFMEVAERVSAAKLQRRIGATMQVLIDSAPAMGRKGGVGRSYADAPEIDGSVQLLPPEKASKTLSTTR